MKNKIFLLIIAIASTSLCGRRPSAARPAGPQVAANSNLEFERNALPIYYLIATNYDVALYYANRTQSFFGVPAATAEDIRRERRSSARLAQEQAQRLLAHDANMTLTPVARGSAVTLHPVQGQIGDVAIAHHVRALGNLNVQAALNEIRAVLLTDALS